MRTIECITKNISIAIAVINQHTIRWLKQPSLMARWPINAHPIIVMAAIAISLDCILIGIVIKSIAISLDCILMGIDSGFDGGFNGGFDGGLFNQFHLAVLGY